MKTARPDAFNERTNGKSARDAVGLARRARDVDARDANANANARRIDDDENRENLCAKTTTEDARDERERRCGRRVVERVGCGAVG